MAQWNLLILGDSHIIPLTIERSMRPGEPGLGLGGGSPEISLPLQKKKSLLLMFAEADRTHFLFFTFNLAMAPSECERLWLPVDFEPSCSGVETRMFSEERLTSKEAESAIRNSTLGSQHSVHPLLPSHECGHINYLKF